MKKEKDSLKSNLEETEAPTPMFVNFSKAQPLKGTFLEPFMGNNDF